MKKSKIELTWGDRQIAKELKTKGMVKAQLIIQEAFPEYRLGKYRKDRGAKRGEKES